MAEYEEFFRQYEEEEEEFHFSNPKKPYKVKLLKDEWATKTGQIHKIHLMSNSHLSNTNKLFSVLFYKIVRIKIEILKRKITSLLGISKNYY